MAAIRSAWLWAPVWMFLVQQCLAGIDEYRLASGDVVEISVIGARDLGHRTASMHVRLQMLWDDLTGIRTEALAPDALPTEVAKNGYENPPTNEPDAP